MKKKTTIGKIFKELFFTFIEFSIITLLSFILYYTYYNLSEFWSPLGGWVKDSKHFDFFLIVIIYYILFFPNRSGKFSRIFNYNIFIPFVIIFAIYLLYDAMFVYLARYPRFSDYQNIPALFYSYKKLAIEIVVVHIGLFILWFIALKKWYNKNNFQGIIFDLTTKSLIIISIFLVINSQEFYNNMKYKVKIYRFSVPYTIKHNGRFTSLLFYFEKDKNEIIKLKNILSKNSTPFDFKKIWKGKIKKKTDVHILVLESFVDPRLLRGIKYSKSPLYPGMKKYLIDNSKFSIVISPVFGGGTPQSEFEILTGVPALRIFNSMEFNALKGIKTNTLISELTDYGYMSTAAISTTSWFFNSPVAYKSLGFQQMSFLDKNSYFNKAPNDTFMFDGDLYRANLKLLEKLEEKNNPYVNYLLGIYGHIPYPRNLKKRPDVLTAYNVPPVINRIANQFYYRTKSLTEFIDGILEIEPDSIILLVSDHLPSIFNNNIVYEKGYKYLNIGLLLYRGKPIDISSKKYYQLSWVIWDLLSGKSPDDKTLGERDLTSEDLKSAYLYLLGKGNNIIK